MSGWKKIFVAVFITIFWTNTNAQDTTEMWVNISPELKINFEDRIWEIRFRPDDHIFLPSKYVSSANQGKMELMLGAKFWKCNLFSHSKFDFNGGLWTGIRFDFNFEFFKKKLLFNIQERYFFALNNKSKDHYYLIQYIRYKIAEKAVFGFLGFGKWNTHCDFNKGNWFMGPSLGIDDASGLGIQFAFTKDIFHSSVYMTFLRISYGIKFKNQSKPINFELENK